MVAVAVQLVALLAIVYVGVILAVIVGLAVLGVAMAMAWLVGALRAVASRPRRTG